MNKLTTKLFAILCGCLVTVGVTAQNELARFEVPVNQDCTKAMSSYETETATITLNKVGGSASNWYTPEGSDLHYAKLAGSDAYIKIKLKDGSFEAGHVVTIAVNNSSQKKLGFYIKTASSGNTIFAQMETAGVEATANYTLTAADLDEDGAVTFYRESSNVFVNRIIITGTITPITTPIAKTYTIAGIDATIDETAKTITAELPYGTDKDAAINAAVVTLGGTATSYTYNTDKTQLTVTDGTNNVTYTLNITIGAFKCGEIINATLTSGTAATVTGTIGGTASVSLSSSKKLDKNKYFGITLASGTFMAGDVVNINVETVAGQGFVAIYADKEMTTPLYVAEDFGVAGDNEFVLPKEATGRTSLWIARNDEINKWNPVLNFISVTRACEAGIAAFTIGGVEATIDQENKTITAELPFGTELNDALWAAATYTLTGPATEATYNAEHTTLTVGETVYTLNITVAAALSDDNTLKSLKVNDITITLVAEQTAYEIVLPYGTVIAEIAAVAETNDEGATATITYGEGTITIVVKAANGDEATYTVAYTIAPPAAVLTEAIFSNGAKGFINNTERTVTVPYLAGTAEPTFVSGKAQYEGTVAFADNAIAVPNEIGETSSFAVTFQSYAPATIALNEEYTFTGEEIGSWIASVYGWDGSKGIKFAKKVEEESNRRISEGKCRVYFFVPACDKVILTSNGTARDIILSVNGVVNEAITSTTKTTIEIPTGNAPAMIAVESNQTGGDGGFLKIQLVSNGIGTGIENINVELDLNAPIYNILGQQVSAEYKGVVIQNGKKFLLQ